MMEPHNIDFGALGSSESDSQRHARIMEELNGNCGEFLTQPLSPLSGYKEMGLVEELGDCQTNLKDSASDIFARYLRDELFEFPASTAPAAFECAVPYVAPEASLSLECSFTDVAQQHQQPQETNNSFLASNRIEIEGIDDIFDFNPDSLYVTTSFSF